MSIATASIRRPVLTWVLSAFIVLLGGIGLSQLGVREYPAIDPPLITVVATYTGANAEVIENQVTEPLEQSLNGIDPVDVRRSYRYEQGFTFELTLAGVGDEQRRAFAERTETKP